ncbi:MAG: hypothetical protein ABJN40_22975 [Sneathiella sp.]
MTELAPEAVSDSAPFAPLSLQEAKDLIRKQANLIIDEDDPIMLSVILHQGFMADYEKLLNKHKEAVAQFMKHNAASWATEVNESLSALQEESVRASLDNTLAAISQKATENDRLAQRIRSHGRALWLATGLTWLAVIALFFIFQ